MDGNPEKAMFIERLLNMAIERWGREEADQIGSALERIADSVRRLDGLRLDPFEEPARTAGSG